ncbi:MAG: GNAT family N-acetyltransferase [Porphyromonas sp.]|nr:GNAT family N-acetyltransferase [Porphyromonas sp.]
MIRKESAADQWQRVPYDPKDKAQETELIALLSEAFGKQYRAYYELQLSAVASRDTTILVANEVGELIAHLQVVPYELITAGKGGVALGAYLYALCTRSSERGHGVMGWLLNEVLEGLPQQGYAFALLLPAERSLVSYYERFGFESRSGGLFTQVPPGTRPLVRPREEARDFLAEAKKLDEATEPEARQRARGKGFIPLRHRVEWMWHPLEGRCQLDPATPLLEPMT